MPGMKGQLVTASTLKKHTSEQQLLDALIDRSKAFEDALDHRIASLLTSTSSSSSSSSSASSSSRSSVHSLSQPEQIPLPIHQLPHPSQPSDIAVDRTDIDVPPNPLASTTAIHIEKLLSIRARHKAPKALITDLLAYIHESFPDAPGVSDLPTTWQQCEQAIQHVKPVFIKV
jgi:hypothetical protein